MKRFFAQCYIWLLLVILYAPIVFIAVFSFTESKVLGNWTGFSTKLYANLFTGNMQGTGSLMHAIQNTIIIALIAATVSTVLGTIAAIGIHNMRGKGKQPSTMPPAMTITPSMTALSCPHPRRPPKTRSV